MSVATAPAGGGTGGYQTPTAAPPPADEACPLCGAPLDPEQEWCLRCGAAARTRLAASPAWKTPVIALAVIVALSLGVLAAALVKLAGGSGHAAIAPTTITVTTPATTPTATVPTTTLPTTTTPTTTPGTSSGLSTTTAAPGAKSSTLSTPTTPGLTTPTTVAPRTTPKAPTTPTRNKSSEAAPSSNPLVAPESPKK